MDLYSLKLIKIHSFDFITFPCVEIKKACGTACEI